MSEASTPQATVGKQQMTSRTMNHRAIDAARRLLNDDVELSLSDAEHAVGLPAGFYTDPDFFAFEKEAILMREWLCVGREEQLPNTGDFIALTIADEPIVVTRHSDGSVRAMSAVCQHRAMVVTDPSVLEPEQWDTTHTYSNGNCGRQLRCPYHFWVYDLGGQLIGAPEMARSEGFDRSDVRLPGLKVEIWLGFIFVNFDPHAAPLAPRLARAESYFEGWGVGNLVAIPGPERNDLQWNWKIMLENILEMYHVDRLHKPIHELVPASRLIPTSVDPDEAMVFSRASSTHPNYSFNATSEALFPTIGTLSDDDRNTALFGVAPPTLSIATNTDSIMYSIVVPTSASTINLLGGMLYPASTVSDPMFSEVEPLAAAGRAALINQDVAATKSLQRGLGSRFAPRGRLSWQEEALPQMYRWITARYREYLHEIDKETRVEL